MPNWCSNQATIHGTKDQILELVGAYERGGVIEHYLPTPRDPEDPTKLLKKIFRMVGKEENKKYSPSDDYIISGFTVVPKSYWDSFKLGNEVLENVQVEIGALLTSSIVVNNAINPNIR